MGNVKFEQTTFGQQNDIDRLSQVLAQINKNNIVGFGVSRGAVVLINLMGAKDPESKKLGALVLESPFAHVKSVVGNIIKKIPLVNKLSSLKTATHNASSALFPQYKPDGIQPIDFIDKIDPNIPIIIIHSKTDKLIPINESRELYIKRKKSGCDNVYLVELDSGAHANTLWADDGKKFQNTVHAFYKKHGLPCNEQYSKLVDLADYQPTVEEVEKRIKKQKS